MIESGRLVRVGFWRADGHAKPQGNPGLHAVAFALHKLVGVELPSVFDHIDKTWETRERAAVVSYVIDIAFRRDAYFGVSTCRICGADNGCADYSDGVFIWPEGLAHYVKDHGVRPSANFIAHVLKRRPTTDRG